MPEVWLVHGVALAQVMLLLMLLILALCFVLS